MRTFTKENPHAVSPSPEAIEDPIDIQDPSPTHRTVTNIERVVNLMSPSGNTILNMTQLEAEEAVASGDPARINGIKGHFAIMAKTGRTVRMARSLGRPMRYFMAKRQEGPCLVVADRIDAIHAYLEREGLASQFHPSYTRMVPAHYVTEIHVVGCPDPNPDYRRFFTPARNALSTDIGAIGEAYIGALAKECDAWLDTIPSEEPIGVLFSGGIDSGAVFLVMYHQLLERGESPSRLKAFTLSVLGGPDGQQAHDFLSKLGLSMFLEVVEIAAEDLDYKAAIRVIEDYKPLDVQAATMGLALCWGIRERYPEWKYLIDGDGGDENLKDYPIEENSELTITSVLNNLMLYQEGWGVDAIKHSLTYSGGQSRGQVRSYAPPAAVGFNGFSPFSLPSVIEVAEGIPFVELTDWDHQALYDLKGEVVGKGIKAVTGLDMPIFPKRRFQHGALPQESFSTVFPSSDADYRQAFRDLYG